MNHIMSAAPPERLVGNHETGDVLAPLRRLREKYFRKAQYIANPESSTFYERATHAIDLLLA
jgi:hypothetical protein